MPNVKDNPAESPQFWLTVFEAADVLGIKRRRMLDFRDQVNSRRVDNPRSGKSYLMFEKASVEAFREQRELAKTTAYRPPAAGDAAVPAVRSRGFAPPALTAEIQRALAATVQSAPTAPPRLGLFLDLDQASAYAGLSRRLLRSMIATGELPARRDGRTWKIRKTALRDISDRNSEDNGV